jgi:hypothetical protein
MQATQDGLRDGKVLMEYRIKITHNIGINKGTDFLNVRTLNDSRSKVEKGEGGFLLSTGSECPNIYQSYNTFQRSWFT